MGLIEEANEIFERDLPKLLKSNSGKWAGYYGSVRLGIKD